jgi:serine/threonine protein kinase
LTDYYTYVKFIGSGSYGSVDLFISKIDNKQYVIKKINTSNFGQKVKELVKQEAILLMQLKQFKHPNIM